MNGSKRHLLKLTYLVDTFRYHLVKIPILILLSGIHGCPYGCNNRKDILLSGKDNEDTMADTERKMAVIESESGLKITPVQECKQMAEMLADKEFVKFFKPFAFGFRPHRLRVEDMVYSGRLDCLSHYFDQKRSPSRRLHQMDFNSFYGQISRTATFPKGILIKLMKRKLCTKQ